MSGIYAIVHRETGRRYIGSSKLIERRWVDHVKCLRKNKHHSPYLQHAWNKYGAEAFDFVVLELCDVDVRIAREQAWLDWTQVADGIHGFNISPKAHAPIMGPEGRRRMIEANKKRIGIKRGPMSAEGRAHISAARLGKKFGPRRPEVGQKIAASLRGKPLSEERKRKISEARTGKKYGPLSEAHREGIRQRSLLQRHSAESKAKIRATHWAHDPERRAMVIAKAIATRTQHGNIKAMPVLPLVH